MGKVSDLGINEFLGLLQLLSRSDRDHHSKRSAEFTAALIGRNILSHPLPDHQVLVQAAGFTASQNVGNQREFGIILGSDLARTLGVRLKDKIMLIAPQGQITPAGMLPRLDRKSTRLNSSY